MIHLEKELNQKPKYLKSLPFTQKFYITLLTKFKDRSIPHILFIWRLEGAMLNSNAGFMMILEQRLIEEFRDLNLAIEMRPESLFVGTLQITNEFVNHIREAQQDDQFLQGKVLDAMGDKDVEFKKDTTVFMSMFVSLYKYTRDFW